MAKREKNAVKSFVQDQPDRQRHQMAEEPANTTVNGVLVTHGRDEEGIDKLTDVISDHSINDATGGSVSNQWSPFYPRGHSQWYSREPNFRTGKIGLRSEEQVIAYRYENWKGEKNEPTRQAASPVSYYGSEDPIQIRTLMFRQNFEVVFHDYEISEIIETCKQKKLLENFHKLAHQPVFFSFNNCV